MRSILTMQSNQLDGIPRPNIINLRECKDRRDYTIAEFKKLGVDDIKIHQFDRYAEAPVPFIGADDLLKVITPGVTSSHLLTIKWWLENTDEEFGLFFEDDVHFECVKHWNFTLMEFIERCGSNWGALQLCNVFEYPYDSQNEYPAMVPRRRNMWDHGLQCYVLKRSYAQAIVDYYFAEWEDKKAIHIRMPLGAPPSFENNVMHGFGLVINMPLFNHNVLDFRSKNIYYYNQQAPANIYSYEFLDGWWEKKGSQMSIDEIFNNDRESHKTYGVLKL